MRVKTLLMVFFCLIFSKSGLTQTAEMDSLTHIIMTAEKDTNLVHTMNLLAHRMRSYHLDSTVYYANMALALSNKLGFDLGACNAHYYHSVALLYMSKVDESIDPAYKTLYKATELGMLGLQSRAHNLLGAIYRNRNETDSATHHVFRAAQIAESLADHARSARTYLQLGHLWILKNPAKSAEYYNKCRQIAEYYGYESILISSQYSLGTIAYNRKENAVAFAYFEACIRLSEKLQDKGSFVNCATAYSEMLRIDGQLDSALHYLNTAERFAIQINLVLAQSDILSIKAAVLRDQGRNEEAIEYFKKAAIFAGENRDYNELWDTYQQMSKVEATIGRYQDAQQSAFRAMEYKDSLTYNSHASELATAITQFETEKKEAEIIRQQLELERQKNVKNTWFLLFGIGAALFGGLFFGFYQRIKRKRQIQETALGLEKERADNLQKMDKVKTDFFNNVSHELRTPLTMILAPLKDVLGRTRNVDSQRDLILALTNSERLLGLTNEILDLSKLEANKLQFIESKVMVKAFLSRVFNAYSSLANSQNIELNLNVDIESDVTITTDVGKLETIIHNLVSNAVKYSNDGSIVHFDAKRSGTDRLLIEVTDEGPGIPKEETQYIFDRYYQSSVTPHAHGTGIGLSLVKKFCEFLGGTVAVESEVGKGSKFMVDLPSIFSTQEIQSELSNESVEEKERQTIVVGGRRPKILIVEDDLEMSKFLISQLKKDYECLPVYNGKQAIKTLSEANFDLITSDVMMSEMDGFEFRKAIIENEKWRDIPFVMLTARALDEDRIRGFRLGIDDYINKPFNTDELKARIYNLIKNKVKRAAIDDEIESVDDSLIQSARDIVNEQIDDQEFGVAILAEKLNVSARQLNRRIRALTGMSPVEFILEIRLSKAFDLIRDRRYSTVNEVRYDVGIESASYFSKKFKERFGINPSQVGS